MALFTGDDCTPAGYPVKGTHAKMAARLNEKHEKKCKYKAELEEAKKEIEELKGLVDEAIKTMERAATTCSLEKKYGPGIPGEKND